MTKVLWRINNKCFVINICQLTAAALGPEIRSDGDVGGTPPRLYCETGDDMTWLSVELEGRRLGAGEPGGGPSNVKATYEPAKQNKTKHYKKYYNHKYVFTLCSENEVFPQASALEQTHYDL